MLTLFRTDDPSCEMLLLRDLDTQRVDRLYDFTTSRLIRSGVTDGVMGRVNSAGNLCLVIESCPPDTRHSRFSNVPVPVDGAEGSVIG